MKISSETLLAACAALLLAAAAPASAQITSGFARTPAEPGFAREGMYLGGAFLPNFTLDGRTFDGETVYREIDGDEVDLLPRLNTKHMLRAVVGFRSRPFALEISYERTQHRGTFLDEEGDANFNAFNVDGRIFFLTAGRIQPHVVVGLAVPWLTVVDGSFDDTDAVGDARWRGLGLNTEAGITIFPHPRLGISVGYAFRLIGFRRVTGVSDVVFDLKPPFKETSGSPVILGFYTF